MSTRKSLRIAAITAAVAAGSVGGALLAAPAISGAQDATSSSTTVEAPAATSQQAPDASQTTPLAPPQAPDGSQAPQGKAPANRPDPHQGGHVGPNGITEELLTGDTATQVTAAATAAVPDGTVLRVENDAEGATYEAHVQKSDGSEVTVKLDASFTVTSIEDGPA